MLIGVLFSTLKKNRPIIYFRTPSKIDLFNDSVFRPFTHSVWVCLLVLVFLVGYLLKVAMAWEKVKSERFSVTNTNEAKYENESIMVTLLIAFGACCQQGTCIHIVIVTLYVFEL